MSGLREKTSDAIDRGGCRRRRRFAFTLIELLALVGILVFLIALLVPALSKAHRQARTITCLSNLRQLHLGFTTYVNRNPERSLAYDPANGVYWINTLAPTFPDVPGMRFCPEASVSSYGWGSAKLAWGPFDPSHGSSPGFSFIGNNSSSYGFNGWLYSTPDDNGSSRSLFRLRNSERIPVFGDANWMDGWPQGGESLPHDTSIGSQPGESDLGRFYLARHGQTVNMAFLDGHAEQVTLQRLARSHSYTWSGPKHADPPASRYK